MNEYCMWRTPDMPTAEWEVDGSFSAEQTTKRRMALELQWVVEAGFVVEASNVDARQAVIRVPGGPDINELWLQASFPDDYPFSGPISLQVLNHQFMHHPTVEQGSGRLIACGCHHLLGYDPQWTPSLTLKHILLGGSPAVDQFGGSLLTRLTRSYKEAIMHGDRPANDPNLRQLPPSKYLTRWSQLAELPSATCQTPRPNEDVIAAGPGAIAQFFTRMAPRVAHLPGVRSFLLGTHARAGAASPVRMLPSGVLSRIVDLVFGVQKVR